MTRASFRLPAHWPDPYDAGAAERLIERFAELGRAEARLAARPAIAAMLRALGGNSPTWPTSPCARRPGLRALVALARTRWWRAVLKNLAASRRAAGATAIAAALRRAKRIVALATAIADIGGIWPLDQVTGALSDLAEAALSLAVAHLLRAAHDAGDLRLPDPADPAHGGGFTVLGMGKLGARELNYSSDVDLVLLYDPAAPIYTDATRPRAGRLHPRIARGLVSLMEARDANGYVFRTDLRLRPDPAVTPPAVAHPRGLTYYESMGQNWERAAMIKARPVAGDLALGAALPGGDPAVRLAPRPGFRRGRRYPRHEAADRRAQGRRAGHGADPVARIAGHNVKLGEGGIREIEFLAQTLQLVWGGRDPACGSRPRSARCGCWCAPGRCRGRPRRSSRRPTLPAPRRASAADGR